MFRATPGTLPAADTREVGGVALPDGRLVTADEGDGAVVAWISSATLPAEQLNAVIRALAAVFPQTGLWPLHCEGQDFRPWSNGELDGPWGEVSDALPVLVYASAQSAMSRVPLITAPMEAVPGPDLLPGDLETDETHSPAGLLLVPVARPADIPWAIGWSGAMNLGLEGADISAVLRSWEDRFGATLVEISSDSMVVQVARRPETGPQLDALVSEHYAFCPDNIDQGLEPEQYRSGLTEWTHWSFWWD